MKSVIYLLLLLASLNPAFAQYNSIQNKVWALTGMAGLDFRSGTPVTITSGMMTDEGVASVADNAGLVLYTNGTNVWNRNHQMMPHGQNINGSNNYSYSSSQSSVIVPCLDGPIDNPLLTAYYVFSVTEAWPSPTGSLFCNKIDMSLNGGLGDIDTSFYLHGVPLVSSLAEKIIVIPGCNNNFWVVVHTALNATFKAYEITQAGINLTPVISTSGGGYYYAYGVMKVNPQCNKIVTCLPESSGIGLEVHDFDITTGIVSNGATLDTVPGPGFYGASFSPNGSKLYARKFGAGAAFYQFDLNAANPVASRFFLGQAGAGNLSDLALGPDGKVYFHAASTGGAGNYLGCINNPDNAGAACGYQSSIPSLYFPNGLKGGMTNTFFLPQHIQTNINGNIRDTILCSFPASGITLAAPGNMPLYRWDDGTATQTRTVSQTGLYWVKYATGHCTFKTDSFHLRANEMPAPVITYSNHTLSTTTPYVTYQWYKDNTLLNGATTQSCATSGDGWYAVKVTGPGGCSDSVAYELTGSTGIADPGALKDQISIYPNPAQYTVSVKAPVPVFISLYSMEGRILSGQQPQPSIDVRNIAEGLYFIQVRSKEGQLLKVEKLWIRHQAE